MFADIDNEARSILSHSEVLAKYGNSDVIKTSLMINLFYKIFLFGFILFINKISINSKRNKKIDIKMFKQKESVISLEILVRDIKFQERNLSLFSRYHLCWGKYNESFNKKM